ncbi:hypothetical protein [Acaryochloris sp. IP29b_bin.137]|uniref:hypothetical protein n=1 Tax=Acaryochloris sp. IP29b_bin.137 TaxID=2969217 RepID=UPI00260317C1|nr:hypothetical protein [Acaryochloris sp. IP29b_bin.137]
MLQESQNYNFVCVHSWHTEEQLDKLDFGLLSTAPVEPYSNKRSPDPNIADGLAMDGQNVLWGFRQMNQGDQGQRGQWGIGPPPAGYRYLELSVSPPERQAVMQLASQVLQDPLAQSKLCDRIYELMQNDLQYQRERQQNYGGRY